MEVVVAYDPESTHCGLVAKITAISPPQVVVFTPAWQNSAGFKLNTANKKIEIPMLSVANSKTAVDARFVVDTEGAEIPNRAEIVVEIWTDTDPTMLVRQKVPISPVL